jgi:D-glycero-D-manno-heptose 1,7-bisphosphate phosphatase
MAGRALILDRDGVINEDPGYLHRIEECRFIDGIFDLTRAFAGRGFRVVIATNQAGIGRGYYGEKDFGTLMDWMIEVFRSEGVPIAKIYHCPDHPTAGLGAYRRENDWRKPGPGMLLQAAADLDLDLAASWSIGDQPSDIAAARAAGVGTNVLFDKSAPGIAREGDLWRVGRLASVVELLER